MVTPRRAAHNGGAFEILSGSRAEDGIPHLRKARKIRLAAEMASAWYDVERRIQASRDVLRAGQRNIGVILARPAPADTPLPLANGRPIERRGKERLIDRIVVRETKRTDEACGQEKTGDRLRSFDQPKGKRRAQAVTDKNSRRTRQRFDHPIIGVEPSRERLPVRRRQARAHDVEPLGVQLGMKPGEPVRVGRTMRPVQDDHPDRRRHRSAQAPNGWASPGGLAGEGVPLPSFCFTPCH